MQYFTALVALVAVAAASVSAAPTTPNEPTSDAPKGLFTVPVGAPNGVYSHTLGLDGAVHSEFHGMLNHSTSAQPLKRGGTGVICQTPSMDSADALQAIQGLANLFNTQPNFSHSVSFSFGTATAYGCDYGHGQRMSGVEVTGYLNTVQFDCSNTKAGYFNLPDAKASYGLTTNGVGFC